MIFNRPLPFEEAIESRRVKALLPTGLSSRELDRLTPDLREQAMFSARTRSIEHLQSIDQIIGKMVDPSGVPGDSWDGARARMAIRASLQRIGYDPADINATPGTLKDLGSERRIRLILDTNTKMAHGYGEWAQGQDEAILDEWPGSELTRHEARTAERLDWPRRFVAAGGRLYGGRMIALKNDPVWANLSRFGLPYPPFDFNSGMGLDDVDRATCSTLGIIDRDTRVKPAERPFREDAPIQGTPEILAAAQQQLGPRYGIDGGALIKRPWDAIPAPERIEAFARSVTESLQSGADVIDAFFRPDTGSIDLRGEALAGLDLQTIASLPETLAQGTANPAADGLQLTGNGIAIKLAQVFKGTPRARFNLLEVLRG